MGQFHRKVMSGSVRYINNTKVRQCHQKVISGSVIYQSRSVSPDSDEWVNVIMGQCHRKIMNMSVRYNKVGQCHRKVMMQQNGSVSDFKSPVILHITVLSEMAGSIFEKRGHKRSCTDPLSICP